MQIYKKRAIHFFLTRWFCWTLYFAVLMIVQKMYFGPYKIHEIPRGFFPSMFLWVSVAGLVLSWVSWQRLRVGDEESGSGPQPQEPQQNAAGQPATRFDSK